MENGQTIGAELVQIQTRLTRAQLEAIDEARQEMGLSRAAFLRLCVDGALALAPEELKRPGRRPRR